ncbi:hypothetical protein HVE01_16070 [Vreelandella venusta]|nr:hypothetical protein HVE01_16070 [Halomonas venusta]
MSAPVFSMTAGTFIIKAKDFIKPAKTSHLFAFGGSIVPGRISIQSHRGRLFVLGSPYNITSLTNGLDGLAAITYNTSKREVKFSYNGATSTLSGLDFSSFNGDGGIGIGVYNTIQDGYDSSLSLISYCPRELTTLELNAITSQ